MNIKKIIILALITLLVLGALAGCTLGKDDDDTADVDLSALIEDLVAEVDVPMYETVPLDETTFEYFTFVQYEESYTAVAADALVNINPHSVVVIHTDAGDGNELGLAVFEKADPNKWLCVGSEVVTVANTNHYVVLVMSTRDIANAITSNFSNMSEALDGAKDITVHTADNTIRYN